MRRIRMDLAASFGLLTRLPVGWLMPAGMPFRMDGSGWCFPLVGAVLGGIAATVLRLGMLAGLPPLLAACWTLVAIVLLTGGLHEDGLADAADGLGGGRTPERRLAIMRDSRIGSFGALALLLGTLVRVMAIAALPAPRGLGCLVCAAALSRTTMLLVLALCPPARPDGNGRAMAGPAATRSLAVGVLLAVAIAAATVPPFRGTTALLLAAVVGLGAARIARLRLGGHTGDVLGATAVVAECAVLSALAAT